MVTLQLVQLLRVIVGMQAEDRATDELWYDMGEYEVLKRSLFINGRGPQL